MNEDLKGHQLQHLPALDGIRGIAVLLVIVSHLFSFLVIPAFGWIGVDVFFVLSGFLITRILLFSKGNKHYFKNFYIRRALRIFPLYFLVLFLSLYANFGLAFQRDRYFHHTSVTI